MRRHQPRQLVGMVGVVGVDEHHDLGRAGAPQVVERGEAGAAVALASRRHHLGAAGTRDRGGAVARVVVGHDDAPHQRRGQVGEHERQRRLLVEGGDDDVDGGNAVELWHSRAGRGRHSGTAVRQCGSGVRRREEPGSGDAQTIDAAPSTRPSAARGLASAAHCGVGPRSARARASIGRSSPRMSRTRVATRNGHRRGLAMSAPAASPRASRGPAISCRRRRRCGLRSRRSPARCSRSTASRRSARRSWRRPSCSCAVSAKAPTSWARRCTPLSTRTAEASASVPRARPRWRAPTSQHRLRRMARSR